MTIETKWNTIYAQSDDSQAQVAAVLWDHQCLLPSRGIALDLACGLGANTLFLAEKGLESHAFDISTIALDKCQQQALEKGLTVYCQPYDIEKGTLAENQYDVIVVSRFLNRTIAASIIKALKPEGLLFYQTFTQAKISTAPPNNPNYLLADNELLSLFSGLKVCFYQEYARVGSQQYGNRNEAFFIGQKR